MFNHASSAIFQPRPIEVQATNSPLGSEPAMTEELLPFTVKLVHSNDDLSKAVQIRHSAYARHLPGFAETLKSPELADIEDGVVVLLAESKLDGSPMGTMRIQTNQFKPLCLEQSVALPTWLRERPRAEATRLGVTNEKAAVWSPPSCSRRIFNIACEPALNGWSLQDVRRWTACTTVCCLATCSRIWATFHWPTPATCRIGYCHSTSERRRPAGPRPIILSLVSCATPIIRTSNSATLRQSMLQLSKCKPIQATRPMQRCFPYESA